MVAYTREAPSTTEIQTIAGKPAGRTTWCGCFGGGRSSDRRRDAAKPSKGILRKTPTKRSDTGEAELSMFRNDRARCVGCLALRRRQGGWMAFCFSRVVHQPTSGCVQSAQRD